MARDKSELFKSILELVFLRVIPVLELTLLLLKEHVFFIILIFIPVIFTFEMRRWRDLLLRHLLPIETLEELVGLDALDGDSLFGLLVQELIQ